MNVYRKFLYYGLRTEAFVNRDLKTGFVPRSCSTLANSFDHEKEKINLLNALPRVIEDVGKHPKYKELPAVKQWMEKVLNGTLCGGKVARGLTTVMAYKFVEESENYTEKNIQLAHDLAWCVELFQAYCIVLDDVADGSFTRRGRPCWYQREDVGIAHALNDAILINYTLKQILRDKFEKTPIYVRLVQAFNETLFYTSIGQYLDIKGSEHKKNYSLFTKENYANIITYKTAYYTYKLPITVGFMLANRASDETLRNCEDICLQLGKLFQIQDDYIDCFGDENLTGKIGTDIQENKCTWLAVNALERCNVKNRTVFAACYGSKEPAHIERIKQLYVQLQLPQLYKQVERDMFNGILKRIESIPSTAEQTLFKNVLNMTYGRQR